MTDKESEKKPYIKTYGKGECKVCGKEFEKARYNQAYCCSECKRKGNAVMQIEYARRRYQLDPEFRKKNSEYHKKYYQKIKAKADA